MTIDINIDELAKALIPKLKHELGQPVAERLLTPEEAGKRWGVSESTVRNWARAGKVRPAYLHEGRRGMMFSEREIVRVIREMEER